MLEIIQNTKKVENMKTVTVTVTVRRMQEIRAYHKVTLVANGRQEEGHEVKGDEGDAAAFAVQLASRNGCKVMGSKPVLELIPSDFK